MSQPLSPLSTINPNATPPSARKSAYQSSTSKSFDHHDVENLPRQTPSSPFIDINEYSPAERKISGKQPSPIKISSDASRPTPLTEDALRENEGLAQAIGTMENSANETFVHEICDETLMSGTDEPSGYPGMDDTHFTAFSAVPNVDMTLFARNKSSPLKNSHLSPSKSSRKGYSEESPQRATPITPSRRFQSYDEGSESPTPRRPRSNHGDTTNLLVDFTEQFHAFGSNPRHSPNKTDKPSPKKSQTQPNLAQYHNGLRTPSPAKSRQLPGTPSEARHLANLLDFDLPPAPTPRSIPTITARELESLKSSFLSQVSSLRATVSGKEAEINSLKDAVGDAERRVGEAMEELRNEKGIRESLQAGKLDWEKREEEMQGVLKSVKEEIMREEREKEQLRRDFEEIERKREEAEARAIDAESRAVGLRTPALLPGDDGTDAAAHNKTVDAAVERVAQQLHTLYRNKHEDKVNALKKSYQARWEKKINDLQGRLDKLRRENEKLRLDRDATISDQILPSATPPAEKEAKARAEAQERAAEAQRFEEQAARLAGFEAQVTSVKSDNSRLLALLESARIEMADLVAATEEMMQLSVQAPPPTQENSDLDSMILASGSVDSSRGPLTRSLSSGLKTPGAGFGGESRIGRMNFGASGGDFRGRSGSAAGRSGIMRSIERMGSGRGHE
ncbi:MAG: hypothetical protein HETSPECPRED_003870 [Heterodermia speciosa]|uniref:Uncharacterized protein n=1 Tax=Heterodermia speciosa TaxID=116794 RepID=A0A8H3F727_9LECA|nr:MAG: hypothetical protein HETSPECPRED_003870 [Heterodermia speciosa]